MRAPLPTCLICGIRCEGTSSDTLFLHSNVETCPVRIVNSLGASLDHVYEVDGTTIYEKEIDPDVLFSVQLFTPVDAAIVAIFDAFKLPRLGGTSGIEGWSSISTFQRCPYAWARSYLDTVQANPMSVFDLMDQVGRAVGSLVHAYLAVYYEQKVSDKYPLSPEKLAYECRQRNVTPQFLDEAWRLFTAYRLYYAFETIKPLRTEALFVDPTTRRSCRTDLLCVETADDRGHPPGLYVCDHKTAQRFDDITLTGWHNDGGIIQQADIFESIWETQPEFQQHGPIQGVIVNIIGKQKEPEFYRTFVHPSRFQIEQHRLEAPVWQAQRQLAMATGIFPRARNGCITRYGKCDHWEHCVTGE